MNKKAIILGAAVGIGMIGLKVLKGVAGTGVNATEDKKVVNKRAVRGVGNIGEAKDFATLACDECPFSDVCEDYNSPSTCDFETEDDIPSSYDYDAYFERDRQKNVLAAELEDIFADLLEEVGLADYTVEVY